MKVDVRDISPIRKEMTIEVPAEEVERGFKAAVRQVGKKARIPGFRKGKAPATVIRQRFAGELEAEVKETLTRDAANAAFAERSIDPLGSPILQDARLVEGEPYRFTLRYEIRPEIEPENYLGQEVARSPVEVEVEDVQNELRRMQEAAAYLVPVEGRAAEKDDLALVDLEGADPGSGEALHHEGLRMQVGHENNLPEFNAALEGRRAGDEHEFTVTYPEDYQAKAIAGKTVGYKMTVRELKRREVPDLNDEFAQDAGEFENLAALREEVKKKIGEAKNAEADSVAKDRLLGKLVDAHDFEVPEAMVEAQVDARLQDMVRGLLAQGIDPRREDIDWKKIRDEQVPKARETVKRLLLLDAIAAKESLEVSEDDLSERIARFARAQGETPEAFRNKLNKEGELQAFKNQVLRENCLDFVFAAAKIS